MKHNYFKYILDLSLQHSDILLSLMSVSHLFRQSPHYIIHSINHLQFQVSGGVLSELNLYILSKPVEFLVSLLL